MVRPASVPAKLRFLPFRGRRAIADGLLTARQLQSAEWRRLFHGVYVRSAEYRSDDHRMWCDAAALVIPAGAAISGPSAVYLWGAGTPPRGAPVTVTVPARRSLRSQERLLITHGALPPEDVTSFGGLPVTTPERTAFDLGRLPDRHQAIMALDAMLHRRLVRVDRLAAFARSRARWRGVTLFSTRLAEAEPLAESPMETLVRLLITDAGLPRPVAQHEIIFRGGRARSRVDLAYPELRIAIEYEGDHHRERDTFRKDIARERRLEAGGWLVLRLTADDVLRTPAATVRLITPARYRRRARPPVPPRGR